jgi:hypothetical protein
MCPGSLSALVSHTGAIHRVDHGAWRSKFAFRLERRPPDNIGAGAGNRGPRDDTVLPAKP